MLKIKWRFFFCQRRRIDGELHLQWRRRLCCFSVCTPKKIRCGWWHETTRGRILQNPTPEESKITFSNNDPPWHALGTRTGVTFACTSHQYLFRREKKGLTCKRYTHHTRGGRFCLLLCGIPRPSFRLWQTCSWEDPRSTLTGASSQKRSASWSRAISLPPAVRGRARWEMVQADESPRTYGGCSKRAGVGKLSDNAWYATAYCTIAFPALCNWACKLLGVLRWYPGNPDGIANFDLPS